MLLSDINSDAIRTWLPSSTFTVLGRSSPAAAEVHIDRIRESGSWLGRRVSGGQTIVTGPGCLMYAVVLSYRDHPDLRMLDHAHQYVMTRIQQAIAGLGISVQIEGVSDLTFNGRKFSGNSMRCIKDRFLYHGTLICEDFDLSQVTNFLKRPVREPDYRAGRSHEDFLTRLPVGRETLKQAIIDAWNPHGLLPPVQRESLVKEAQALATTKYEDSVWTLKVP